jgi:adenylate cyclase
MTRKEAASLDELMASSWLYRFRKVMRFVPRSPRCKVCNVPFAGPGRAFKLAGLGPSRKNPNMCTTCFERAPVGGTELEIGVLFADVRGFTSLAEEAAPEEVAARLAPFYKTARSVLIRHDAIIDKLVGDEVMALFIPTFIGEAAIDNLVSAGVELHENVGQVLPVGAGPDFGPAYVGNVGEEDVKDFTALGDVVNTAAPPGPGRSGPARRLGPGLRWGSRPVSLLGAPRSRAEGKGRARSRPRDRRRRTP